MLKLQDLKVGDRVRYRKRACGNEMYGVVRVVREDYVTVTKRADDPMYTAEHLDNKSVIWK